MKSFAILAFVAGAGLTLFLLVRAGLGPVANGLETLGVIGLIIVTLAHLPIVAMLGGAWWMIGRQPEGPGLLRFIWARATRDAAAEALPFSQVGGYVIGARALSLAGADAASSGVSTFLDLVLELVAKLPYVLLGFVLLQLARPNPGTLAAIIAVATGIVVLAVLFRPDAGFLNSRRVNGIVARRPRLAEAREQIAAAFGQMTSRRAAILASILLHFACWIAGAAETWLILRLMGVSITPSAAIVVDSLLGALRALSFFVPAAIGVQEGGYVLLCGLFGISPGAALAFSFARRARDILIAAPVLLSWQFREGQALLPGVPKS